MKWITGLGALLLVLVGIAYLVVQNRLNAPLISDERLAQLEQDVAAQDEAAFPVASPQPAEYQAANPLKNAYFGDLHVHSELSFDAYIFGNRLSLDETYRVAKGEPVRNAAGEIIQLTRPLDFTAVTDHAEGFGLRQSCEDPDLTEAAVVLCGRFERPDAKLFLELRNEGQKRPPVSMLGELLQDPEKEQRFAEETWAETVAAADQHNEPGEFTTFAAYEYSPPLPDAGKIHRNVVFRSSDVPGHAISAFHALTELDLWDQLMANCQAPCEFLTIPHNPNKSWGLAFAGQTIDGDLYTEDDWAVRDRVEPLVEMFQIKGNSECSVGFGTTDEECGFEQFLRRCEEGQKTGCIFPTSMARDGLREGLRLEAELGINPLDFGMIGSTDAHNSNPGDAEEWDYRGSSGLRTAPAKRRLGGRAGPRAPIKQNPGGLAVVWAEENTRDALFEAMQNKEVYATSGTRIRLRFFGSFDFEDAITDSVNALEIAYRDGLPMGGRLESNPGATPSFLIWATRDPLDAPLDRVQVIKGWLEDGETKELVQDVICSDGRAVDPETMRCAATSATVDLSDCSTDPNQGASELRTLWTDDNYRADQSAFYYVRVIQNPTCRWSTFDSLRLGRSPPPGVEPTVTEMAWSSPIWIGNR